ncbi:MAG: hypothetical protein ACOX75_05200 [Lachnospiraceae bacterium]|jgi:hypothetical protein
MKKILAILLVVAVVFALFACGNSEKTKSVVSEITDKVEFDNKDMISEDSDVDADGGEPSKPEAEGKYTLSNEVLVDNEHLTVTAVEAFEKDDGGFVLKLLVENKSDNNTLCVKNDSLMTYNGYMVSSWWTVHVAPGDKAITEMFVYSDELPADAGVAEELTFHLIASNYDDINEEYYIDDYFVVYPTGLDADSVTYRDRPPVPGQAVIVDNEDLKFIIESARKDDYWGYLIHFYVENRTETTICLAWSELSANGFEMVPSWKDTVLSGKRKLSGTYISPGALETNGITDVEEIEFRLVVRNLYNYYDKIYLDETFTFNP